MLKLIGKRIKLERAKYVVLSLLPDNFFIDGAKTSKDIPLLIPSKKLIIKNSTEEEENISIITAVKTDNLETIILFLSLKKLNQPNTT